MDIGAFHVTWYQQEAHSEGPAVASKESKVT